MAEQIMDLTKRTSYKFTKADFGDAVYISVLEEHFWVTLLGQNDVKSRGGTSKSWGFCVNRETYDWHGGLADPFWVLAADEDEEYVAVTQGYWDAYQKDQHRRWCYEKQPMKQGVLETLQAGDFNLIVRVSDSVLYDLKGEPVPRRIFIDYISGNLRGGRYYMKKLTAYLKEHPQCVDVNREPIPFYNSEFRGETAVECYYVPKDSAEFKELMEITDCFERMDKIHDQLGVKKFMREGKKKDEEN